MRRWKRKIGALGWGGVREKVATKDYDGDVLGRWGHPEDDKQVYRIYFRVAMSETFLLDYDSFGKIK